MELQKKQSQLSLTLKVMLSWSELAVLVICGNVFQHLCQPGCINVQKVKMSVLGTNRQYKCFISYQESFCDVHGYDHLKITLFMDRLCVCVCVCNSTYDSLKLVNVNASRQLKT